ncbi:hypothetical protein Leryth_004513, partial [Lithospermum erythrorhizon]
PKVEVLEYDDPPKESTVRPRQFGDNGASSSGSNIRSTLIGMGFKPYLVDKAIMEKGESNIDVLLEALFLSSDDQNLKLEEPSDDLFSNGRDSLAVDTHVVQPLHKSNSSDSLDSLFGDDEGTISPTSYTRNLSVKEEDDTVAGVGDEKRAILLKMSFSLDEIRFAMDKLGEDAPINELVDIIFARRIAKKCDGDAADVPIIVGEETKKDCDPETLFGTMEKTLKLIEMGFSENDISAAIEIHGSEVSIQVLAEAIISGNLVQNFPSLVKVEECSIGDHSYGGIALLEKLKGKRPKEEYIDELTNLKRPKQEYGDSSFSAASSHREARSVSRLSSVGFGGLPSRYRRAENREVNKIPEVFMPKSFDSPSHSVSRPPYFFYGNVKNISHDTWMRISQFLYDIQPELVNTGFFSAFNRDEGYVHNLPQNDRCYIDPKPPTSIQEAMPQTKKWWPSWDTRKHVSSVNCESSKVSQICDRIGRMLTATRGDLSSQQQRDVLHHCQTYNLMWVGKQQLAPIEPETLELLLGYPVGHTQNASLSFVERLESLQDSFQVDALAYHLSVLKFLYPEGVTVLSINDRLGGAEVALDKLKIRLKGVVSIEPSETNRRILKRWWKHSSQSGELVQIDGIQMLSSSKLENLLQKFGGFDLVICQNPPLQSSNSSKAPLDDNFDFSSFCEFVRVIQRVRR